MRPLAVPFRAAALLITLSVAVLAQTYTATILGTVRDASGAVLPGAHITLESPATGFRAAATSDRRGSYVFPDVPVGTYQVRAAHRDFKISAATLTVHVAQQARLDFSLAVGSQAQAITVSGAAALVATDSSELSTVVPNRAVVDLPLNGRDYTQLAALAPDVENEGSNGWASGMLAIGGARQEKTQFLVNGEGNTETWSGGSLISPSPDAIQEFSVQTNMAPAEYGRGVGFVNATTKSGGNQVHGSAYEFHRDSGLDARNFFALDRGNLLRNQFGFALGAPLHRDKTFLYTNYERTNQHQDVTESTQVATAAERAGDFSADAPVINPATGQPFAGNHVGPIAPIAQYFLASIPLPNQGNRLILNAPQPLTNDLLTLRLDQQGENTRAALFYMYGDNNLSNAFGGQIYGGANPLGNTVEDVASRNFSLDITHSFSPTLLLELRGGYYYNHFNEHSPADSGPDRTVASGIGGFATTTQALGHGGYPEIDISGYGGIPGGTFLDIIPKQGIQSYLAAATWVKGAHTLKVGAQLYRELGTSHNYGFAKGDFAFTGQFSGNAFADFLLGYPFFSFRSFPQNLWGASDHSLALYAQDQWQATPNLTLNLGLRLESDPWPNPINSGANFDPALGKIVLATRNGQFNFSTQTAAPYLYAQNPSWYVASTAVGAPYSLVTAVGGHFDPRFGFAWRPFGGTKTVVRGGVGIFTLPFLGQIDRGAQEVNPPWFSFEEKVATTPTAWATMWPEISLSSPNFQPPTVTGVDTHFKVPTSTEWNLTVERQLGEKNSVSVGYAGNVGTHLESNANFEQPHYGPNAFSDVPFPQFGVFGQAFHSNANSNHHALQVQVKRQATRGLLLLASYSWSKTIDYTSNDLNFVSDRFNFGLDRGLSDDDTGHRLVTSFVYDLPFGPGERLLSANGWAGRALGGWQLAGIATFQAGLPFTVHNLVDNSGFFVASGQRADRTCGGGLDKPTPAKWFDTACFQAATPYTVGNSGRNILRADGIGNFDLSLLKDIRFTEARYVQLRAEAFNALNSPTFQAPNTYFGSPTFGQVTAAGEPRILQLGAKLYF